jgi:hypothetical protein
MTVEHVLHASIPPVGWGHVAARRLASTLSRLCEIGQSVSGSQRSLPPAAISDGGMISSVMRTLRNYDLVAILAINASIAFPQSRLNW